MHDAGQYPVARELCSLASIVWISLSAPPSRQTLLEPRDTRVEKFAKRGHPNAIAARLLVACDNRRLKNRVCEGYGESRRSGAKA